MYAYTHAYISMHVGIDMYISAMLYACVLIMYTFYRISARSLLFSELATFASP